MVDRNKAIAAAISAGSWPESPRAQTTSAPQVLPTASTEPGPATQNGEAHLKEESADGDAALKTYLKTPAIAARLRESGDGAAMTYSDAQCIYRGGDPRLEEVVTSGPAVVLFTADGLELLIFKRSEVTQTCKYSPGTIQSVDAGGRGWAARDFQFDAASWNSHTNVRSRLVKVSATDPEGISPPFVISLEFRNAYHAQLFAKRLTERFCPIDMVERCRLERERQAAMEQVQAEELKRQAEAAAKQRQDGHGQGEEKLREPIGTSKPARAIPEKSRGPDTVEVVLIGTAVTMMAVIAVAVVVGLVSRSNPSPDLSVRATASDAIPSLSNARVYAVHIGSYSAWVTPIYDDRFPRPDGAPDPQPGDSPLSGQSYLITIQIRVPHDLKHYPIDDLSGEVVGTDGYRQQIPKHTYRVAADGRLMSTDALSQLPVEKGVVEIVVKMPGSRQLVKDTIILNSKLLNEEQTLEVKFK